VGSAPSERVCGAGDACCRELQEECVSQCGSLRVANKSLGWQSGHESTGGSPTMIDRYLLHTREHQAELHLDAIQQRLIAQARQPRATQKRTSRTVSRIVGVLDSVRALHTWRLGDVRSA
jgi:hypothetical protein